MANFEHEKYDPCKKWIKEKREIGFDWEEIRVLCTTEEDALVALSEYCDDDWPEDMDLAEWNGLVSYLERIWKSISIIDDNPVAGLERFPGDPSIVPLSGEASTWAKYKKTISKSLSDESVAEVEKSCKWILAHLKLDTRELDNVKGLVMGSVQSGKTSNMCGLVSMAADLDWNIFIVLSGSIDNLRIQTRDRFKRDLQNSEGIVWNILDFAGEDKKYLADSLQLNGLESKQYNRRYLTVCLKQRKRLETLIDWLYSDENRTRKMRIIVIDDEADQASVNTAKIVTPEEETEEQERRAINQLIINLVNGKKSDGSIPRVSFQSMNYISYTATPYANVLNEPPGESLYPSDFICTLEEAKEYFGAKVIFGNDEDDRYPGLDIIRTVPPAELATLRRIQKGESEPLPDELKKSLTWFLCSAAVLRKNNNKKPISMLIHTAAKQDSHFDIHTLIQSWFSSKPAVIDTCKSVYEAERNKFKKEDLEEAFSEYGLLDNANDNIYTFDDILPEINTLLSCISALQLDDDRAVNYHKGIHLCVDNCKANKYAEEGTSLRIVYPTDEQLSSMPAAPAFIIIGGNTLSRGLTIEGLVCSYFTRNSTQADTLMQMARWFGYRKGFELLQRIWMAPDVISKFKLLTKVDMDLKNELRNFMEKGISPEKYGPRIRALPTVAKLRITAKNKSQSALEDEESFDFSGLSHETTQFDEDISLKENIDTTDKFLTKITSSSMPQMCGNSLVWRNVSSQDIIGFLEDEYHFSEYSSLKVDVPIYLKWLESANKESKFTNWSVAVAGDKSNTFRWDFPNGESVGYIQRTRKSEARCIDIGSLRSGRDVLCDVQEDSLTPAQRLLFETAKKRGADLLSMRAQLNLHDTPILLIYRIDKNGGKTTKTRSQLSLEHDIIGLSIITPGDSKGNGHVTKIKVNIPSE